VLCQGLADSPCLAPIEQDWKDAGPVEEHLSVCEYMRPPDVLLKEAQHSLEIPMRRRISASLPPSCEISDPR